MKRFKIFILLIVILILANSFSLAAPEVVIKFGFVSSLLRSTGQAVLIFKDIVESRSDGRIEVQIYSDAQLGNDRDLIEGIRLGTVQMMGCGSSPFASLTDSFLFMDLPFIAPSREAMYRLFDGEVGQEILADLSQYGIKGLSYWESGLRHLLNNVRPLKIPADLKGLKIRVMENPVHLNTFRNWGALPTPIPYGELFSALQTGIVDGFEGDIAGIYSAGLHEISKNLTMSGQFYLPWIIIAGQEWWDSLEPEYQKIIQDAVQIASQWQRAEAPKAELETLRILQNYEGMDVYIPTEEERAKFAETSQPVYEEFSERIGKERLHNILKELNHPLKDVVF